MRKGLMINQNLKVEIIDFGINYVELKGLAIPPSFNNNLRFLSIDKSLDGINGIMFSDNIISNINQQIKDLLNITKWIFSNTKIHYVLHNGAVHIEGK